jgi:hypothetical protein
MSVDDDSTGLQRARKKVKMGSARVVASLLLSVTTFGAVALGVSWKFVDNIAQAVTPISSSAEIAALDVPIINARRAPQTLSEDIKFRTLNSQLATVARRLPNESCLIVDVEGKRLVNNNPDLSLLPASNMKIVVAAVALDVLGEDFQYTTQLVGNVNGGALYINGDAVIVGNANIQGNLTYTNLTNLTTANLVLGLGNNQTGVNVTGGGIAVGNTNEATMLYDFASASWRSNINFSVAGNIAASGSVSATGAITGGNINTAGDVSATGNILW